MPSKPATAASDRRPRCTALTTGGDRCKRRAVPGLTVCKSHGGGTAASVRKSNRAKVADKVHTLWGIAPGAGGISTQEELERLARNKMADVNALRIKIGAEPLSKHIGHLTETIVQIEYDIEGTVQSKSGTQVTRSRRAGTSVWVQELHKAEAELLAILRLLHEVTGSTEETDVRRIRMQTAREVARLMKAFPGLGVDEIAMEVSKRAS